MPGSKTNGWLEAAYYLDLVLGVLVPGVAAVGFLVSGIITPNIQHIVFGTLGGLCAAICLVVANGLKDAMKDNDGTA